MKMKEFWETIFINEKTTWGFEPSDSALLAKGFFLEHNIKKILIPGAGYGRNAIPFLQAGFDVTGIEIAKAAIELASKNNIHFPIYHGSVLHMPFDNHIFDGIFCYALVHLLNRNERKFFLKACYNQLTTNGYMIFTVVSRKAGMYGTGKLLSKDRYKILNGLKVFFYDDDSIYKEFKEFGLLHYKKIDEPIKHMQNIPPLKCYLITCKKE